LQIYTALQNTSVKEFRKQASYDEYLMDYFLLGLYSVMKTVNTYTAVLGCNLRAANVRSSQ